MHVSSAEYMCCARASLVHVAFVWMVAVSISGVGCDARVDRATPNGQYARPEKGGPDSRLRDRFLAAQLAERLQQTSGCRIPPPTGRCVRFVDAEAAGEGGDGRSWCSAYRMLQEGIDAAREAIVNTKGVDGCEVWIRAGVYYVFRSRHSDTVRLEPGVRIYGGFWGNEVALHERDALKQATILDGRDGPGGARQVYHVVTGADNAVIDGVIVTGGNARLSRHGGGMYNDGVSPIVSNVRFVANEAGWYGGAIFNSRNSLLVSNCEFIGNSAREGGAVYTQGGEVAIENTLFADNSAAKHGGALGSSSFGETNIENSIFLGNDADALGGAIYNRYRGDVVATNCTFYDNAAGESGSAIASVSSAHAYVYNSIIWKNIDAPFHPEDSLATVRYSLVQGGFQGEGNMDCDPELTIDERGLPVLTADSPCIDSADGHTAPKVDFMGNARLRLNGDDGVRSCDAGERDCVDGADMGAIEYFF